MIYHLFRGRAEHHIPSMLQFFLDIHDDLHTPLSEHVFVFHDPTPKQLETYKARLPATCRVETLKPGRLGLWPLFKRLGKDDSLILHSAFYPWVWIYLLLYPRLRKRTAWIMWGADIYGKKNWRGALYR